LIKNSNLLIPLGFHKGHPSYRRSIQRSKENIKHFKDEFSNCFLFFWVIVTLLDPDPGIPLIPDLIRIQIHNTGWQWRCPRGMAQHGVKGGNIGISGIT